MTPFVAVPFCLQLGSEWIWGSVGYSWFWLAVVSCVGVVTLTYTNPPSLRPTGENKNSCMAIQACAVPSDTLQAGYTAPLVAT